MMDRSVPVRPQGPRTGTNRARAGTPGTGREDSDIPRPFTLRHDRESLRNDELPEVAGTPTTVPNPAAHRVNRARRVPGTAAAVVEPYGGVLRTPSVRGAGTGRAASGGTVPVGRGVGTPSPWAGSVRSSSRFSSQAGSWAGNSAGGR